MSARTALTSKSCDALFRCVFAQFRTFYHPNVTRARRRRGVVADVLQRDYGGESGAHSQRHQTSSRCEVKLKCFCELTCLSHAIFSLFVSFTFRCVSVLICAGRTFRNYFSPHSDWRRNFRFTISSIENALFNFCVASSNGAQFGDRKESARDIGIRRSSGKRMSNSGKNWKT